MTRAASRLLIASGGVAESSQLILLRVSYRLPKVCKKSIILRVPPALGRAAHGTTGIRFGGQLAVPPLLEQRRDMPTGTPVPPGSGRLGYAYFRRS
jgi:hypothetical protein